MNNHSLDHGLSKVIMPNKAAIYVRWSTDEQTDGNTLSIQLGACNHYLKSQGWQVNENLVYIDEGCSGGNLDRPAMKKLRRDVKKGLIDCVIIWKIDRLSRSIVDTVDLVLNEWKYYCYVKSVNEPFDTSTPMGMMVLTLLASFAQMERESIFLRTFSGRVKSIEERGKSPGIRMPYGYKKGDERGTFKIIENEAEIVRRIFKEYIDGDGIYAITYRLNEEGIPSRTGKSWSKDTLSKMIANPIYTGKLIWGKMQNNPKRKMEGEKRRLHRDNPIIRQLSEDVLKPIISKEDFEKACEIRKSRNVFEHKKTSGRIFDSPNLLAGLLRCKKCGSSMYVYKRTNSVYTYYACRGHREKGVSFCDSGYIREEDVNQLVVAEVKKTFLTGETNLLEIISERYDTTLRGLQLAQTSLEAKLKQLDAEYAKVFKDYRKVDGGISAEDFNVIKADITQERNEVNRKLESCKEEYEAQTSKGIDASEIIAFSQSLTIWDELTFSEQKRLLYKWIDRIELNKNKGRFEKFQIKIRFQSMLEDTEEAI